MTAMFPATGVPATDARNTILHPSVVNCDPLWYSTSRCQPRFDPEAANAMLAEQVYLINQGEVQYDCNSPNQVQLAVRRLIQRGLPHYAYLYDGPFNYSAYMDPPLTRYNDGLTLTIMPSQTSQGAVRININNLGFVPLLRNDHQEMQRFDLNAGATYVCAYYAGAFHLCSLAASQVPIVLNGTVWCWVRPDGNDVTGDGTQNTPDRAFRTIWGAYVGIGSRYAATALFTIGIRFGVPATYEGCWLSNFGGNINILGDPANRAVYKLSSVYMGNNTYANLFTSNVAGTFLEGFTFCLDTPAPWGHCGLRTGAGGVILRNLQFENNTDNAGSVFYVLYTDTDSGCWPGSIVWNGNSRALGGIMACYAGNGGGSWDGLTDSYYYYNNCHCSGHVYSASALGIFGLGGKLNIIANDVTGVYYLCRENSIMYLGGRTIPGTTTGIIQTGGQVV